jgi:hypothetical protein
MMPIRLPSSGSDTEVPGQAISTFLKALDKASLG